MTFCRALDRERRSIVLIALAAVTWFPAVRRSSSIYASNLSAATLPDRLFDFHSGLWLNLHHFLYQQALLKSRPAEKGHSEKPASDESLVQMSSTERQAWDAALGYYAKNLIKRDLLFDDGMAVINDRLANAADSEDLNGVDLDSELSSILKQAAAVYRSHWWAAHNAANHRWIDSAQQRLKQMGAELAGRLTTIYRHAWPEPEIRVEVAEYANWAGAYTVNRPEALITISSVEEGNGGDLAIEILFHESSHVLDQKLRDRIDEVCKAGNLPVPRQLYHVIIFYTAGEITRQALERRGNNAFVPYANRYGLYDRAKGWKEYYQAVQKFWQPYLDGKASFNDSIADIVKALSPKPG